MKVTLSCAALALCCATANAALSVSTSFLNLEGGGGELTNVVVDNSGTVLAQNSGFAAVGVFNLSNSSIQTLNSGSDLDTAFFQFGASSTMNITGGAFQATATDDVDSLYDGVNPFAGARVYVVIGNQADLSTSTEFIVWDSGVDFSNLAPSGGPDTVLLDAGSGTLVVGRDDLHTFDMSGFGGSANEIAFTTQALPVPEPSSTALLGLGAFAFVLRRRR